MAATTTDFVTDHGTGDRVVLARALPQVPRGTTGTIRTAAGVSWPRYWVQFDNGEWVGSVSATNLVAVRQWSAYERHLAEEAARPKEAPKPAAEATAAAAPAADGGGGAASRIPAHLLERSKAARARKTGG